MKAGIITLRRFLTFLLLVGVGAWLMLLVLERQWYRLGENYSLIEDGLYMGGDVNVPPPGTRVVLNLCERKDPYECAIHLWEPINDGGPAPAIDWLRQKVEFIAAQRQAGQHTYIHCRNGVSRSGLVVTAYVMHKNRWTRDEALAFVRTKRPEARPHPVFMELLLEWEREVIGAP